MKRRRYQTGGLAALDGEDGDQGLQLESGSDEYPANMEAATATGDQPSSALMVSGGLSALGPDATEALQTLRKSSAEARAALQEARAKIQARKYNNGLALLAISSALGAPTRTGSTAEGFANMARALQDPVREKQAFEQEQQKELLGVDTQLAGLDERAATAQLQLAMLRAKLANQGSYQHYDKVLPDGTKQPMRFNARTGQEEPAGEPYKPQPPPGTPQFQHYNKNLPDGTIQPMRFNVRTGEEEPAGEPYKPTPKLSGSALLQAQGKLQTTAILRSQLQDVRDRWFGFTDDKGVAHPGIKDTLSAGKYQGWVPSEAGESFDKAVAAMRGTIRQLTRVPGEGSMSDWEGKIDQAKLPERSDYESVTEQTFDQLEKLINGYENTTRGMLGMDVNPPNQSPSQPKLAPATTPAPTKAQGPKPKESAEPPSENPDDQLSAVAPPEALAKLQANPTSRSKAWFLKTFGYLPKEFPWDKATRGEYVKQFGKLPDGYE